MLSKNKKNNPLISIVIPVYNVADYIERCFLSVLSQNYLNLEIILVDDCSPDNSMDVINKMLFDRPDEKRVIIIKLDTNKGLSEARNAGIMASTGEYIYFLDSDDELYEHSIKILVDNASDNDVTFGSVITNKGYQFIQLNIELEKSDIINSFFSGKIYSMAWNKLINTNFLLKNNLFFEKGLIHEDFLWTYQVASNAQKIKIIPENTYIYHIRDGSLNVNVSLNNIHHYLYGFNIINNHVQVHFKNNPHALNYVMALKFGFATRAVKKCKCSVSEYMALSLPDTKTWNRSYKMENIIKYLFFEFPAKVQYYILKYLFPKK